MGLMGGEQKTPRLTFSCGIRFEESMDKYRIKCTHGSEEAAKSLPVTGVGTNHLEVGDIFRGRGSGCK